MKIRFGRVKTEITVIEPASKAHWEPQAALDFLFELSQCLNRAGIRHWVTDGSLLGLIRQNALLAWDNDIDIAVSPGASFEAMHRAMDEAGQPLHMIRRRNEQVISVKVCRGGIRADIYLLSNQGGKFVDYEGSGGFTLAMSHPAVEVVERIFANRTFPVPAKAEAYLTHLYGPSWKIPHPNWSWKHTSANRLTLEFNSFRGVLKYSKSWLGWHRKRMLLQSRAAPLSS
jgi:LicD family